MTPASMGKAQQLGTGKGSAKRSLSPKARSTLVSQVASLRHTVSVFLGWNDSHHFLFNSNHLTVLEKWFPFASGQQHCVDHDRQLHANQGEAS